MIKVMITDQGRRELDRLKFDIISSIHKVLEFVPMADVVGLSEILIADQPTAGRRAQVMAAYCRKVVNHPARIELYLINMFRHIKEAESFNLMLPIQEFGLAKILYHEIGHHVRITKKHGIENRKSENYAEHYAETIINHYILASASAIDDCFSHLENVAEHKDLSQVTINKMKSGWREEYKKALMASDGSRHHGRAS